VVPIESLAPDEAALVHAGGLEASFRTFEQLVRQPSATAPSLDALLAGVGARDRPAPAPTQPAATRTPPAAAPVTIPPAEPEPEPVAIGTLCYRGQAALERANALRHQIAAGLTSDASIESLQPLLQELLDLVPLALEQS
jgi:hypothetical protein